MKSQKQLRGLFIYSEGALFWLVDRPPKKTCGSPAGWLHPSGYVYIGIDGKNYAAHRLIFLYHHGYLPEYIDHIDGNSLNNKIENLRQCTFSQNLHNSKLQTNNTSGVKGVSFSKADNKWRARIQVNGESHFLGQYSNIDDAERVVKNIRVKLHKEFANHG